MTQNQIRLGELREAIRHNLAMEGVQKDTNRINEQHFQRSDAEVGRHNLIVEQQSDRQLTINENTLAEQVRHNKQSEAAAFMQAAAAQTSAGAALLNAQASQRSVQLAAEMQPYNIRAKQSEQYLNTARATEEYANYARTNEQTKQIMKESVLIDARTSNVNADTAYKWTQNAGQVYTNENILPSQKSQLDSQAFKNTTSGVRDISGTVKDISDVTYTWVNNIVNGKKKKTK